MRVYEKPPMFLASFLGFMAFRELLLDLPVPGVSDTRPVGQTQRSAGPHRHQE